MKWILILDFIISISRDLFSYMSSLSLHPTHHSFPPFLISSLAFFLSLTSLFRAHPPHSLYPSTGQSLSSPLRKLFLDDTDNDTDCEERNSSVLDGTLKDMMEGVPSDVMNEVDSENAAIGGALVDSLYSNHRALADVFQFFDCNNR